MKYIKNFDEIRLKDLPSVGGKNANLGTMIGELSNQGITVPLGFAITADAYWYYLQQNNLTEKIEHLATQKSGAQIRPLIEQGSIPQDLAKEITDAYQKLCEQYKQPNCDVAVRSSATAEDLPTASFAGAQETYLNVRGPEQLLAAYKKALASLFTDRAIQYRADKGFTNTKVALSVGVQKMIRSDKACSGVMFTLDTETGFKDVVVINASYGLGEMIVKGEVTPDEYMMYKPFIGTASVPLIKKQLGVKERKMIYTDNPQDPTTVVDVSQTDQQKFCLTDAEITSLARMGKTIEDYYTKLHGAWSPMDIEWAKDGNDGKLYIIQARPETVHAHQKPATQYTRYVLKPDSTGKILVTGQSVGQLVATGNVRIVQSLGQLNLIKPGDIMVTEMTDPDWLPAMQKSAGIITVKGGRTCHAAIVSRELGIPAIVGAAQALEVLKNGQLITLDCSQGATGYVYEGKREYDVEKIPLPTLSGIKLPMKLMVNIADPDAAFATSMLPTDGVGLARMEFIINTKIRVHPMALVHPEKVTDATIRSNIESITAAYHNQQQFFIDVLAQSISMIAAAFYPKPVIVRMSDFKSNEYRNLIGGTYFEPEEENPMLGWRGASRYYSPGYQEAFALECAAVKKARETMGFKNIKVMVPFVRTVTEGQKVLQVMKQYGLQQGAHDLEIIMMCEIPSNVLLIDEFSKIFDGFSIGSNDLTQLTLGVDRDSTIIAPLFDERDAAVKKMLAMAITGAQQSKRPIGICGQAPSDYPEIAEYLIKLGISSLSLNPDSIIPFLMRFAKLADKWH